MKQSLLRAPKVGIPLRGKMKKIPRPDFKPQGNPNSEDLDASFSVSPPLPPPPPQISTITDDLSATSSNSVITAAGDLDEVESNYPIISLLSDNSSEPSVLPEFPPASSSIPPASFFDEIGEAGGSCVEEILTELSEVAAQPEAQIVMGNFSEKDEGEGKLEVVLAGFSTAMEKLCDVIMEVLLQAIEQRKRRNGIDRVFFLMRLGEKTLAFFISVVLASVILNAVAPEGCPILNNLSEFNGPTPT